MPPSLDTASDDPSAKLPLEHSMSYSDRTANLPTTNNPKPSADHIFTHAITLPREICLIALIISAQILARAGLSQSIAPINYIGTSFGSTSTAQTLWFPAAFSLTAGTFILIAGRLGDIHGHKLVLIYGFIWYALWSLLAGMAVYSRSIVFFDVCRALQGVGAAFLTPTGLAILGSTYKPGPRKNMVFAIFGAAAPNGFVVGALFSALLAQLIWWPWAYWIMAISCSTFAIGAFFAIPNPPKHSISEGSQTFDYLGCFFGVAGLILFNVAWNQAPFAGWKSPYILVLLILGVIFCFAFFMIEKRASQPIFPVGSMSKDAAFVLGCVALGWSSFGIWMYYFWVIAETLRGATPLNATAQIVPGTISGLAAALTTGYLLSRVRTSYIIVIALMAFCTGNVILATMPVHQSYWKQSFWAVLIMPWGMDMSFPAATIIMSNLMPKSHQGIAASSVAAVVNYSISIGLGIAGTVELQLGQRQGNRLKGYRGALYAAVGLSGCGILLAMVFVLEGLRKQASSSSVPGSAESSKQDRAMNLERGAEDLRAWISLTLIDLNHINAVIYSSLLTSLLSITAKKKNECESRHMLSINAAVIQS